MNKIKGVVWVVLFMVVLLTAFCRESKAQVTVEIGPTFLSGDFAKGGYFILSERFGKYDIGIGYISEQEVNATCGPHLPRANKCLFEIKENIFIHAQRIVPIWNCELGIGPVFYQNTNRALGKRFAIGLYAGCNLTDHWRVVLGRHSSNAGSGTPNLGQDSILGFSHTF